MSPRRSPYLPVAALVLATSGLHCARGDETPKSSFTTTEPEAPADAGNAGNFGDASTPPTDPGECSEGTKQIYVVATDKTLYRFYPAKLEFVRVGSLACPTGAGTFSMAIDRRGTAWVLYQDGNLFAVDTNTAACRPTAFVPGQVGFETFGMGYAKNDSTTNAETLYIAGAGLGALDTKSFDIRFIGSLSSGSAELTSIDTALYSFTPTNGVIARLNKSSGATESVYRSSAINAQAGFAFAQWGGDFWLFTGTDYTEVTRYSPVGDSSSVVVQNTGMLIVGAGSSTCAPTKPPG